MVLVDIPTALARAGGRMYRIWYYRDIVITGK
jgi:hypothetical protein